MGHGGSQNLLGRGMRTTPQVQGLNQVAGQQDLLSKETKHGTKMWLCW